MVGRVHLTNRPHQVSRRQVINCNQYSIFVFNCTAVGDVYAAHVKVVVVAV